MTNNRRDSLISFLFVVVGSALALLAGSFPLIHANDRLAYVFVGGACGLLGVALATLAWSEARADA